MFWYIGYRKHEELSYPKKSKNVQVPHSSNYISTENATPFWSIQSWKYHPIWRRIPISVL